MKANVTRFKNPKIAIKELESFIKNGFHLETGKPFKNFGELRSRELLANWLISVIATDENQKYYTFTSDPSGGDGIIIDTITEETYHTEHIIVPSRNNRDEVEKLILQAINKKNNRGNQYASGKTLVVLLNCGGEKAWFPNTIARSLPKNLHFASVWIISLQTVILDKYTYGVTVLDISQGNCPVWHVRIGRSFDWWRVERIQWSTAFHY